MTEIINIKAWRVEDRGYATTGTRYAIQRTEMKVMPVVVEFCQTNEKENAQRIADFLNETEA